MNWWEEDIAKPGLILAYRSSIYPGLIGVFLCDDVGWIHASAATPNANGTTHPYVDWNYIVNWLRGLDADVRSLDGLILQRLPKI